MALASPAVPAMGDSAALLQVLLSCPTADLGFLTEVIRNDIGLAIELLRCRDDSMPSDGFSISKSVVHAGVARLSALANQIEILPGPVPEKRSIRKCKQFWAHSRVTALMAEELAMKADCDPEEAYVAGLLFRIGELPSLLAWKWNLLTTKPREVAQILANMWRLPSRLTEILSADDLQLPYSSRTVLQIVRVADQQAWRLDGLVHKYARSVF
jgi:HD-like signal output (HDOD) protein